MTDTLYTYGFVIQIPAEFTRTYANWLPCIVDSLAKDKRSIKWVDGRLSVPTSTEKPFNPIWQRVMSLLRSRKTIGEDELSGLKGGYSAMLLLKL